MPLHIISAWVGAEEKAMAAAVMASGALVLPIARTGGAAQVR